MDYTQFITIEPGKRSGQPCTRGMRITVRDVLEYLAGGIAVPELRADFPELTADDVRACLAFTASQHGTLDGQLVPIVSTQGECAMLSRPLSNPSPVRAAAKARYPREDSCFRGVGTGRDFGTGSRKHGTQA